MIRRLAPLACLALGMCATMPSVNCANAQHLRSAALFTLQTLDRVCPVTFDGKGGPQ